MGLKILKFLIILFSLAETYGNVHYYIRKRTNSLVSSNSFLRMEDPDTHWNEMICGIKCSMMFIANRSCLTYSIQNSTACNFFVDFLGDSEDNQLILSNSASMVETKLWQRKDLDTGYTALIFSGEIGFMSQVNTMELISPYGNCTRTLSPFPVSKFNAVSGILNNFVAVCSGLDSAWATSKSCYRLIPNNGTWEHFTDSVFKHYRRRGHVYKNKLYITDSDNPEVYDPQTNTWSIWDPMPIDPGFVYCSFIWKDIMVLIGGYLAPGTSLEYNFTSNSWFIRPSPPFQATLPSCDLIPGHPGKFLIVEFAYAAVGDLENWTWKNVSSSLYQHNYGNVAAISGHLYAFGGGATDISISSTFEEYIYDTDTWMPSNLRLSEAKNQMTVIKVPSAMFGCTSMP